MPQRARLDKYNRRNLRVCCIANGIGRVAAGVKSGAYDRATGERRVAAGGEFAGYVGVADHGAETGAIGVDALRVDQCIVADLRISACAGGRHGEGVQV